MTLSQYSFALPTRIEFGEGVIGKAGSEAKALGATKVMLVADKGVIAVGWSMGAMALWAAASSLALVLKALTRFWLG